MSIRTSSTTLLQIFCKTILDSKVIVKSVIDPDDTILRTSLDINGFSLTRETEEEKVPVVRNLSLSRDSVKWLLRYKGQEGGDPVC